MLILASKSPRRKELLRSAEIEFKTVSADVDETALPDEHPEAYVIRLAVAKAVEGAKNLPESGTKNLCFLGADTAVVIEGEILGKPESVENAYEMLQKLSGKTHTVMSAYCLFKPAENSMIKKCVKTSVTFNKLSRSEIEDYLIKKEWEDKAGAYAIQGEASKFIKELSGSFTSVVGLPLPELLKDLKNK